MEKIIFQNEEWADVLYCYTTVNVSLGGRIKNLFCPKIQFEHKVYCKKKMPVHKAVANIKSVSYWRLFTTWYRKKFYPNRGYEFPSKPSK